MGCPRARRRAAAPRRRFSSCRKKLDHIIIAPGGRWGSGAERAELRRAPEGEVGGGGPAWGLAAGVRGSEKGGLSPPGTSDGEVEVTSGA